MMILKNKKGVIGIKTIVSIILVVLMLYLIISIFLNPDFFSDAADKINNIFNPPEKDPVAWQRRMFNERQEALDLFSETIESIEYTKTKKPGEFSWLELDSEFFERGYSITFTPLSNDKYEVRLLEDNAPLYRKELDMRLCVNAKLEKSVFVIHNQTYTKYFNHKANYLGDCTYPSCASYFSNDDATIKSTRAVYSGSVMIYSELKRANDPSRGNDDELKIKIFWSNVSDQGVLAEDINSVVFFKVNSEDVCIMPVYRRSLGRRFVQSINFFKSKNADLIANCDSSDILKEDYGYFNGDCLNIVKNI